MNPLLVYLLLILAGAAWWTAAVGAWPIALILMLVFALLLGQWAAVKVGRLVRRIEFDREIRQLIKEEARK